MNQNPRFISIGEIQRAVARAFGLSMGEMLSRKRCRHVVDARQAAMYLSRELAGGNRPSRQRRAASFPRIGLAFARDHTSVIHACKVVTRHRLHDCEFARLLDELTRKLNESTRPIRPQRAA